MVLEPLPGETMNGAPRSPAAILLAAAVLGMLMDRWNNPPAFVWCLVLLVGVGIAAISFHRRNWQIMGLCVAWASIFALWHQSWWADPPSHHIYHWTTETGRLAQVVGRVVEPSWTRQRSGSDPESVVLFEVEGLVGDQGQIAPSAGRLRVQIADPQIVAWAGERWKVTGQLVRPAVAGNPGGFDYRQWLRTQGVQAVLQVSQSETIVSLPARDGVWDELVNWRQRLRRTATQRLSDSLAQPTASVAEAMLLGTRSQLPEDVRLGLIQSGLLHVLAISGLNVAVIWLGMMRLFRLLGLSLRTCHVYTMIGLIGYAWLTDANPPIVRAVSFACVWQLAELSGRRVSSLQAMSLAALVVIARNPTDLFNPAAWLSFLSVSVLAELNRTFHNPDHHHQDDGQAQIHAAGLNWLPRELWRLNLSTAAVWCATVPLVASKYHLVSFVGWGLNVVLSPLIIVMMWFGYLWLVLLAMAPPISDLALWPYAAMLQGLLWITHQVSLWGTGFGYFTGPPDWWLAGLYAGGLAAMVRRELFSFGVWCRGLSCWVNVGLAWALLPSMHSGLTCDVLAVRHGLAVVVQSPQGQTLVYDAGSFAGSEIATEAVSQALWTAGQTRIDALILSHADSDHCNGVPGLAQRFDCGVMLTHQTFEQNTRPTVQQVLSAWEEQGGRRELISRGDQIEWDPDVRISLLHPRRSVAYPRDNANSAVVLVEYAGRRLLLTGDLEREGLAELLGHPREAVDFVISPHHGSQPANPVEFGAWTNPVAVAVSASHPEVHQALSDRYPPETLVLNTATSGRIRCQISPDGELTIVPHLR